MDNHCAVVLETEVASVSSEDRGSGGKRVYFHSFAASEGGRWKVEGEVSFNTSPQLFVSSRKRQLFSPGAFHTNAADIQVKTRRLSFTPQVKRRRKKISHVSLAPSPLFFESACSGAHTKKPHGTKAAEKEEERRSCGFFLPLLGFFFNDH